MSNFPFLGRCDICKKLGTLEYVPDFKKFVCEYGPKQWRMKLRDTCWNQARMEFGLKDMKFDRSPFVTSQL